MTAVLSPPQLGSPPRADEPQTQTDVIRCRVGEDVYCLEMAAVGGVKPARDMAPISGDAPEGVIGLIAKHRQNLPVFDLAMVLGTTPSQEAGHYVVLIDHPTTPYGLRVDSVSRVIRLAADHVMSLPPTLTSVSRWFRGVVDFTRVRRSQADLPSLNHLPGISEPKQTPSNRRRSQHQMQLLLNPDTLIAGTETTTPPLLEEHLKNRYRSVGMTLRKMGNQQLLLFPLGHSEDRQVLAGLSITQIVEITEPLHCVPVPGAAEKVIGFVHWRNCPVPVIDFARLLGMTADEEDVSHLLVLRDHQSQSLIAIPASGRIQSVRLPIPHQPARLSREWAKWLRAAFTWEERMLVLPNLPACADGTA